MSWFLAYSSLHICIFDWLKAQDVTLTSKILSKEIGKEAFTRAVAPVLHVCVCMKVLRVAYTTSVSLIQVYYGSSQIQEEARGFAEAATLLSFLQFTLFMFPP